MVRRALTSDDYDLTDLLKQTYRVLLILSSEGLLRLFEDDETRDFVSSRTESARGDRKPLERS